MAPRNAVGKSIVSVSARSTRCSMSRPSDLKPEPKRLTRSASWPKGVLPGVVDVGDPSGAARSQVALDQIVSGGCSRGGF